MVIGIDLGGMSAKGAVLKDGVLLGKTRVVTSAENGAQKTAEDIIKLCKDVCENAGVSFDDAEAIGIGSPGVIDSAAGTVVHWSNYGWRNVPLAELIRKGSGKRVFITNDANAAALGEGKFGAGKQYSDSVLVTLGTGVGGGIILGGKLFEGFRSAGAEIGHMVIKAGGNLCSCGRQGCFEAYASATALIRLTREEMQRDPNSKLWDFAPSAEKVDGRTAFEAAKAGDESAKRVVSEYIAGLGEGIANLINLLRPQAVILGGGVSAQGEALLAPLREYVKPRMYVSSDYAPFEIVCARLGNDAGLYGAAQYAYDRLK